MDIQLYLFCILTIVGTSALLALFVGDVRRRQLEARHEWQKSRLTVARALMAEIQAGLGPIEREGDGRQVRPQPSGERGPLERHAPSSPPTRPGAAGAHDDMGPELKLLEAISQRAENEPEIFSRAIRTLLASSPAKPPIPVAARAAAPEAMEDAPRPQAEPEPVAT